MTREIDTREPDAPRANLLDLDRKPPPRRLFLRDRLRAQEEPRMSFPTSPDFLRKNFEFLGKFVDIFPPIFSKILFAI